VPALQFDGATLRLTRRQPQGVQIVAWSLRGDALTRWTAAPTTRAEALQETWFQSYQLLGNEPGQLRALPGVASWQMYCYRGNGWSNCQSSGDLVADAAPPPPPPPSSSSPPNPSAPPPAPSPGAALLMAMIIVALVATMASAMVWTQWRAIQVEAAERARTQSYWVLAGALDWARLILREDARENQRDAGRQGAADHLGEPWAVPLAEARLSTFLAADRDNTDEAPDAFLSGVITDAQSRYNLANLASGGKVVPVELTTLQRLCEFVGVSVAVADQIAESLRQAGPQAAEAAATGNVGQPLDPPILPTRMQELAWLGVDAATIAKLQPFVTILPATTPVNLNTAPKEVIAAVIERGDLASAERIVRQRERDPLRSLQAAKTLLGGTVEPDPKRVAVTSDFFEVRGRLRLEQLVVEETSLVQRRGGLQIVALRRERIGSTDAPDAAVAATSQ
jgi:general secretion pathway protein K